jgi:hypothetical protein
MKCNRTKVTNDKSRIQVPKLKQNASIFRQHCCRIGMKAKEAIFKQGILFCENIGPENRDDCYDENQNRHLYEVRKEGAPLLCVIASRFNFAINVPQKIERHLCGNNHFIEHCDLKIFVDFNEKMEYQRECKIVM